MVARRVHGRALTPRKPKCERAWVEKIAEKREVKLPRKRAVRAEMKEIIRRLPPQRGLARDGQLLEARERDLGTTVDGINFANK